MLEVFFELLLIMVLFYCLTLTTVNEDNKCKLSRKEEQVRKRRSASRSHQIHYKDSDCISVKRQRKSWISSCANSLKNFSKIEDSKEKLKEFPFIDFIDKSVGSSHIEILEKSTNTLTSDNCIKSDSQTPVKFFKFEDDYSKTNGNRKLQDKESLTTFTPSFHNKLQRQLIDLIRTYWDYYITNRTSTSSNQSSPYLINSNSYLLEDMDCSQQEKSSLSQMKNERVFGEGLPEKRPTTNRVKPIKSTNIKSLLKKELEEILNIDQPKNTTKSCSYPSNVCVTQRVEVRTSSNHNKTQNEEGILRTTSYQALVDNLQYLSNVIQQNYNKSHSRPDVFYGLDCFEALNNSKSRFLLNRQLVKALKDKTSHQLENNELKLGGKSDNDDDIHLQGVVVNNELGDVLN